jgi:hypothetical protein
MEESQERTRSVTALGRWKWENSAQCNKRTPFGALSIHQMSSGKWIASRDSDLLLASVVAGCNLAPFSTSEEAQRAADAHVFDGREFELDHDDGLVWVWPPTAMLIEVLRHPDNPVRVA